MSRHDVKERRMNRQRGQRGEGGSGCDRTGSRRKANLLPLIFVNSLILYQQKKKNSIGENDAENINESASEIQTTIWEWHFKSKFCLISCHCIKVVVCLNLSSTLNLSPTRLCLNCRTNLGNLLETHHVNSTQKDPALGI